MNPALHVQRFLEEVKAHYSTRRWEDFGSILRLYARFLENRGYDSVKVSPEVVEEYLTSLYLRCCYARLTLRNHANHLRIFYEYLRQRDVVQASPVLPRARDFLPLAAKDRSYTNEELLRSFREDWRKLDYCPIYFKELDIIFRKLALWLEERRLRVQGLDSSGLTSYARFLEEYRKKDGANLAYDVKQLHFQYAKWVTRWLYRNGYRPDDPSDGLRFKFSQERIPGHAREIHPAWESLMKEYYQDQIGRWRTATFKTRERPLKDFFYFLEEEAIFEPNQITKEVLERHREKVNAKETWGDSTKWHHMTALRLFMNWLEASGKILINPVRQIRWPKRPRGLPTRLMSTHEVSALMAIPDTGTSLGLRNRAVFELMYSTGLRAGEVAGLKLQDIDFENGLLRVNEPKGGPDHQRVVPIGHLALDWLKRYLDEARHEFAKGDLVFVTARGNPMAAHVITSMMRQYAFKRSLRKTHSSHSWRVTCATMMLKNRADIRHVQEQLGHKSLESTKLYTRLMPMDLKKAHERTHPREREWRKMQKKSAQNAESQT